MSAADIEQAGGLELLEDFVAESLESLHQLPAWLDAYRCQPEEAEPIHAAFRAVHSIKGCAACLGLDVYKRFAHLLENVLAEVRDGKCQLTEQLQHALIRGFDALEAMLQESLDGNIPSEIPSSALQLLEEIRRCAEGAGRTAASDTTADRIKQLLGDIAACGVPRVLSLVGQLEKLLEEALGTKCDIPLPASEPADHGAGATGSCLAASDTSSAEPLSGSSGGGQANHLPEGGSTTAGEPPAPASRARARFVRIREERLDEFLEDVSELFIATELLGDVQGRIAQVVQAGGLLEEMRQIHRDMKRQVMALQHSVMSLRRVAISDLFSSFPRMARSLAAELGKMVRVHVQGEDTEIDKVVAEDLESPLTHLVRNAIDHGLQTPEQRRAQGLSETGNLWLKAESVGSRVRITVQDDGRGIDPQKLRTKALEKGILTADEADALSDEDAIQLIFHPGLSTAQQVTTVSGRGVGMDVVRSTMLKHNGEVWVQSQPGQGATVRMEIPLREAVLVVDGLLVRHAGQDFVLPFQHVQRIVQLDSQQVASVQQEKVVAVEDQLYHAVSLDEILDRAQGQPGRCGNTAAVVSCKYGQLCLLFEQLMGTRQIVLRSMNGILAEQRKISGVAQLGAGRMALVLNVPEMVKAMVRYSQGQC